MTDMETFEDAFKRFKEGKVLVFSDPNTIREFFDFLQSKGYTPTAYARNLALDLEVGFKSLVGIKIGEGSKEVWGSDEDKKYNISRVGTIIEVVAMIEIKEDDFFGCGAHEYCEENNLQHTVSQPGEKWFVDLWAESACWRFRYSLEDELSLFTEERKPHFPYKSKSRSMRFYKNYDDIVRDRRDTEGRRRGEYLEAWDFQFVRFMSPRTVTVDGIAETL